MEELHRTRCGKGSRAPMTPMTPSQDHCMFTNTEVLEPILLGFYGSFVMDVGSLIANSIISSSFSLRWRWKGVGRAGRANLVLTRLVALATSPH